MARPTDSRMSPPLTNHHQPPTHRHTGTGHQVSWISPRSKSFTKLLDYERRHSRLAREATTRTWSLHLPTSPPPHQRQHRTTTLPPPHTTSLSRQEQADPVAPAERQRQRWHQEAAENGGVETALHRRATDHRAAVRPPPAAITPPDGWSSDWQPEWARSRDLGRERGGHARGARPRVGEKQGESDPAEERRGRWRGHEYEHARVCTRPAPPLGLQVRRRGEGGGRGAGD